jgi:hypothetical protein
MASHVKLAGIVVALLVFFLPSFALADDINFGVDPSEVRIDHLSPGQATKFELTIRNNDAAYRIFTLAAYPPPEGKNREGTTQLPDGSWIGFSSDEIGIAPYGQADVTVTIAIPRDQKWVSQDWETWLGVTAESSALLGAKLYVRLLVSTSPTMAGGLNMRFVAGLGLGAILLGCGGYYYFRRRARFE